MTRSTLYVGIGVALGVTGAVIVGVFDGLGVKVGLNGNSAVDATLG